MKIFLRISILFLLSCKTSTQTAVKPEEGYFIADFDSLNKIDTHVHLNTLDTTFIAQAAADKFRFLDIVDDRPFGVPMPELEQIAIQQTKSFPDCVSYATTFSVKDFNEEGWEDRVITDLKTSFRNGAIAVKVWKNIGMALKDKNGTFVMIDDARFDKLLNFLAENKIPLIGHLGEPRECWLPLDKMELHRGYYSEHPEYHMYLHPEFPSYEKQVEARDNMLRKHTDLTFIGAHLGSVEWSLDELAKRLDKFPNMAVDLARMTDLFLHAKKDLKKTRDFFIRYQDRLLYATDVQVNETKDEHTFRKSVRDARIRYWLFFTADTTMNDRSVGNFRTLHLPREVVDKIYYRNAVKWLPGIAP
jgi:hypothetical protein